MRKSFVSALFGFLIVVFYLQSCNPSIEQKAPQEPIQLLKDYVKADNPDFGYVIEDSIKEKDYSLYHIKMTSGQWLNPKVVNEPLWWHWVDVVIPTHLDSPHTLLFIGGGSSQRNKIFLDSLSIAQALASQSVVAHISNVPFQPLSFVGSDSIPRFEDDIIAYGWDQFLSNGAKDEDVEWLARFPMTRAVVKAMDVIQEITEPLAVPTEYFFVSGASKRGWTTWTTAAVDDRVMGIAPLVIDMLNLVPSFQHHYQAYGAWSPAVKNYVDHGIMEWMGSDAFERLLERVEPYRFRHLFDMPKLLVNGTIDEFFLPDSWKFYWNELPGEKFLQYVPNGNHGLAGSYRSQNVYSFYRSLIKNKPLPKMDWKIDQDSIYIKINSHIPYEIAMWKAHNSKNRDFRSWEVGKTAWKKTPLLLDPSGNYAVKIPKGSGFMASLVEVVFDQNGETPITLTTGTAVKPDDYPYKAFVPNLLKN
jgi:PhoPQ-activated pathogenicity-related protein